jgi:HAD superfamily hydrolase (TIGR01458 family)
VAGVLVDIDGVLTVSWQPLPGAVDTLRWLDAEGLAVRLVTNTSSRTRAQIAATLRAAGMPVDPSHISTAVSSAARFLAERYPGEACLVVNEGSLEADLVGVTVTDDLRAAGVVLLGGAGPSVGYRCLDAAFKLALGGTPVFALHRNTRFQGSDGPALDMGAFVVGLEAAAGIDIPVVGKPAPAFFRAALAATGVAAHDALMVGDDIDSDVRGAQALGLTGVLVRTGKFRPADLDTPGPPPDRVIDGIGDLPDVIRELR